MAQISRPTRARVALEAQEVLVVMRLLKSFRETLVAKRPGQAPPTHLKTIYRVAVSFGEAFQQLLAGFKSAAPFQNPLNEQGGLRAVEQAFALRAHDG